MDAFTASEFATGLILDLVTVTIMMVVLAVVERRRIGLWPAVAMVASLSLSVSMSLAIYILALWRGRDAPSSRMD